MPWGTNYDGTPSSGGGIYNQFNQTGGTGQGPNGVDIGSAFGFEQYNVPSYNINQQSFVNPVGDQSGNWNAGMQNYYGVGANQFQAPTMNAATLGPAAQSAGPDMGQFNQTFNSQQGLANQYAAMAAGKGPSMAAVQAQQQGQQNLQAQMAAMGSARGSSNPALAQYNIGQQAGQIQNQTNQNAVMGRTAEEMGALGAEGNIYGQMQQGALGAAGMGMANNQFNATQQNQFGLQQGQFNQQAAMANLNSALQAGQINAQQYNNYMGMLQQQNLAQYQGQQNYENLAVQQQLGVGQIQANAYNAASQRLAGTMGGFMGGLGGIMGGF